MPNVTEETGMVKPLVILQGDWIEQLRTLKSESVHCAITSPPYWGLRDYGVAGQLGLEKTPYEYVSKLVEGFREVRRVLRDDGTLWCNLGDSYTPQSTHKSNVDRGGYNALARCLKDKGTAPDSFGKPKDLVGIPWRVAFALQADGWYLRSDIIWHKPNPMPESVTDRPTKAHEYIFLLTKREKYFYDGQAIAEQVSSDNPVSSKEYRDSIGRRSGTNEIGRWSDVSRSKPIGNCNNRTRNKRTVWTVPSQPYKEAHFATFPEDLIKPCVMAGTSAKGCCPKCGAPWERVVERIDRGWDGSKYGERVQMASGGVGSGGTARSTLGSSHGTLTGITATVKWQSVCECHADIDIDWQPNVQELVETHPLDPIPCTILDPFAGSGTTGQVALELGRRAVLIELNPEYVELIQRRCDVTPGLPLA